MKKRLASLLFLLFIAAAAYAATPVVCDQQYALCTSASCIPDPNNVHKAICNCVVQKGQSAGFKTCAKRAPKINKFKITQLISTFSFIQFTSKKSMDCDKGMPWSNCVDAPCSVDPMDASKAICSCKLMHDQAFFTFGGACDTKTCATGFWSGATIAAGTELRDALAKQLNHDPKSLENTACVIRIKIKDLLK
jgi:hypothetical protein